VRTPTGHNCHRARHMPSVRRPNLEPGTQKNPRNPENRENPLNRNPWNPLNFLNPRNLLE
jgi:hypothetical protein